jgi:hypothetical protein
MSDWTQVACQYASGQFSGLANVMHVGHWCASSNSNANQALLSSFSPCVTSQVRIPCISMLCLRLRFGPKASRVTMMPAGQGLSSQVFSTVGLEQTLELPYYFTYSAVQQFSSAAQQAWPASPPGVSTAWDYLPSECDAATQTCGTWGLTSTKAIGGLDPLRISAMGRGREQFLRVRRRGSCTIKYQ